MVKSHRNAQQHENIVINELNIRSADRTRKDVSVWRNADKR